LSEALDEKNWATWYKGMTLLFKVCRVEALSRPNAIIDPQGAENWSCNDAYATHLIFTNLSATQLMHVVGFDEEQNAQQVWSSLVSLYQPQGIRTMRAYFRTLCHMTAAEDENIPDYITNMKSVVEQLNLIRHNPLKINDIMFQSTLMMSLPISYDTFLDNRFRTDVTGEHPASALSTERFIQKLNDEYHYRIGRKDIEALLGAQQTCLAVTRKKSLTNRISGTKISSAYCRCCKKRNHTTDECRHLGKPLCVNFRRFGHTATDCWRDNKQKKRPNDNNTKDNRPFKKRIRVSP
jgi:hypothetical protein